MSNLNENTWAGRQDAHNRSHIPAQPKWLFFIRIAQLVVAFIVLVLTAYAAGKFHSGDLAGFGLAWFTFILTVVYIVWLLVSTHIMPTIYNLWAQLGLEIACVIFWLCTWAVLASEGADLNYLEDYYSFYGYHGLKSAIDCIKASAGLGALVWVLFIVTLVFFVMSLLSHRKGNAPETAAGGIDMHETKPAGPGPIDQTGAAAAGTGYPDNAGFQQQPVEGYAHNNVNQGYEQQPVEGYAHNNGNQVYEQQPAEGVYPQQPAETYAYPTQQQSYEIPDQQQQQQQPTYAVPAHQQV